MSYVRVTESQLKYRRRSEPNERHGMSQCSAYRSWAYMIQRCENPSKNRYYSYGARGIAVCERWRASFSAFLADLGPRPEGKTLDRVNNDGDYEPGNCRWATIAEQSRNRRNSTFLTYKGTTLTVAEWARVIGVSRFTLHARRKLGWSTEDILTRRPRIYAA